MLKPIIVQIEDPAEGQPKKQTYGCAHWKNFPATGAGASETSEVLRERKILTEAEYQRYQTWQRECGLLKMDETKCLTCTHVRKVEFRPHKTPQFVTLDGLLRTDPVGLDMSSMSRYRHPDLKAAAAKSKQDQLDRIKRMAVIESKE